jgi:hypothetical protein
VVLHGRGMCGGQGERVLVRGVLVNSRLQVADCSTSFSTSLV